MMSIWICRVGRNGEYEARFIEESKIFYTYEDLNVPLSSFGSKKDLKEFFLQASPAMKDGAARVYAGQGYAFFSEMKVGDWVVVPSKTSPGLYRVYKITGDYVFDKDADESYRHSRAVEWLADLRREQLDQELFYDFGHRQTIYKVSHADELRSLVRAAEENKGNDTPITPPPIQDLEEQSLDEIAEYIIQNFKGHGLARIIEAILVAKGFTVYRSPEGPDHGVDLLASAGALGFSSPKICVQVKSTADTTERVVLDQLLGTMTNTGAEYGLLVSWSGFKSSITRDISMQFFKVRLWQRADILNELLSCYDKLDDELKQKIPLKRIWVLEKDENV